MSEQEQLSLADIPGLGPVRRQALAEAGIRDLQDLLNTKVVELAAVRGIGLWQARRIREHLRQRGLILSEEEDGSVIVAEVRSPADVQAMAEAMSVMEETAAREAEVEEEVELLTQALEEARAATLILPDGQPVSRNGGEPGAAESGAVSDEDEDEAAASDRDEADDDNEDDQDEETETDWADAIREQRERLPETALTLMEAIRQAAVARQLTRQITRLLITAGEFAADERHLSEAQQRRASDALSQVEQALQRAVEKRAFRPSEQKDLADRIRRRRKQLEKLLDREQR